MGEGRGGEAGRGRTEAIEAKARRAMERSVLNCILRGRGRARSGEVGCLMKRGTESVEGARIGKSVCEL